ncbi:signal peptidase II [Verrucomicrobiaceae bacterium N1E253]|uniref:Lipoprotein signal peptidase n=1 Tax=Oceaniferula marina TaxID=2748318 RepID=A0A851GN94_9BACT|nr:signal peptidase II [Oceaniferula marina]NWK56300.1 signal peptidase II [Oceaniferula marina]
MTTALGNATMIRLLLVVTLPLYILDQITKWWIVLNFKEPSVVQIDGKLYGYEDTRPVIEGFFNLVRRHNQGVAFGIGNGTTWAPVVFLLVLIVAIFVILYFWKKGAFTGPSKWSAPLLMAGIVGNLTDRLLQGFWLEGYKDAGFWERLGQGYVVDFLDFFLPVVNYRWPAFNVADSCISIAAVLLFLTALTEGVKEWKEKKKDS